MIEKLKMNISFVLLLSVAVLVSKGATSPVELVESHETNYETEQENQIKNIVETIEEQGENFKQIITVFVPEDEISAKVGGTAVLPCQFSICPSTGSLVKITWKAGNGPTEATRIATCYGYDVATGICDYFEVNDQQFEGRIAMVDVRFPSLNIVAIDSDDNRNFWCQVHTEDDFELGVDMKSVVLRLKGSPNERPKFNRVSLPETFVKKNSGESVTFSCSCSGYHCDDVEWYIGPSNEWESNYISIYSKKVHSTTEPIVTISPEWEGRIAVQGYELTIHDLQMSDSGRYWCEARGAAYYNLGETGTDAKSVVLEIDLDRSSTIFDCNSD